MRIALQLALAAAVAGGSVALGGDMLAYPTGNFGNTTLATVSHTWRARGNATGKSAFAIGFGDAYYGQGTFSTYVEVTRTKPSPDTNPTDLTCYMFWTKGRKNSVHGGVNSKKLAGTELMSALASYGFGTNSLIQREDPLGRGAVAGNVTLTSVRGSFSTVFRKAQTLQNVDASYKYGGTVSGGPNDGRTITGTVRIKGRNLSTAQVVQAVR